MMRDPTELYKYKALSDGGIGHVEAMLRNRELWYSSPLRFNDPFDCRRVFDIQNTREGIVFRKAAYLANRNHTPLKDALAEADGEIPSDANELEHWQRQQIERQSRSAANTGILCLTPICDNFLMWTHYAKDHTGICIQFRVQDIKREDHIEFFASAQPVEYADRCPVVNFVRDETRDIVRKIFLTKATPFRYEREWRIVRWDEGEGLKKIPTGIIGAVILGCEIDPADADRVIRACAAYDGDVEIVRARLNPKTYGLTMELEKTV